MKFNQVTSVRSVVENFAPAGTQTKANTRRTRLKKAQNQAFKPLTIMVNTRIAATSKRLFLALWPDPASRAEIEALSSQIAWPAGSAVYAPQDWHVTLHFLGNVPVTKVAEVEAAVNIDMPPVTVSLDMLWLWQRGLVVLGASVVPPELAALHDRLGARLQAAGFALDERSYRPHVTLARRAEGVVLPDAIQAITLSADRFALVESTGDRAARYKVLRWSE